MVIPAPKTPRATVLQRVADRLALRTQRGVVVYMQTDSINDQGSDDGRFGSWHGGLQALFEKRFPVTSVTNVINKMPLPDASKPSRKWFGFENFLADYSYGPPVPSDMEPYRTSGVPSGAGVWGLGRQASFQSAGSGRARKEYATGFHTLIRNNKPTDKYNIYLDNETTPRIKFEGGPVTWRKHMITGLDGGEHTFRVEFVTGSSLIFNDIAVYRGTENRGIRVYNGGRSGVSINSLSTVGPGSDPNGSWATALPYLADDGVSGPDIVINSIGTNNMGDPVDQFKDMMRANTALIRKHAPNSIIFFMIPQEPWGLAAEDWPGKIRISHELAAEFDNVIVTPLTTLAIPQGIPQMNRSTEPGLMLDGLHGRTPLYTGEGADKAGKTLTYGYATTSFNYITGAIDSGVVQPPVEEEPPAGGGTPVPADTTPPTVMIVSPADGFVVPDGGTVDFIATASDSSGIGLRGFFASNGTVIGPGSPVSLGNGQYGHLGITAAEIRALGTDRWFATFKDASPAANTTTTAARTITAADPATPVDTTLPVISNVTPAGPAVFGANVTVSATVTHAQGIELVIVYREAVGKQPEYVGALTKGAGDTWSGVFPSTVFLGFTGFTILTKAKNGKTAGTAATPYSFAAPDDTTAPTGVMLSPTNGLTVADELTLRTTAIDAGTGVVKVDFYSDGYLFAADATLRSGTTANGTWGADVPLDSLLNAGGPTSGTREIHARFEDAAHNVSVSPSIYVGLPEATDPGSEVFPSFDSVTFMPTRPEVLAAWLAAFGAAGGGSNTSFDTDPDGTPVLVIGA
ncbi:SGNH/GDSL hydrolase family protein [Clavibacter capsici]|nr:SGNH/GDSL hydrolase family protein [Clavibacter capsici]